MSIELEVVMPPGEGDSVELIHALTWAKLRHSVGLETALKTTRFDLAASENQFRALLQSSWRRIAGLGRQGKIEVWGIPIYEGRANGSAGSYGHGARPLTHAELRNCKFLSWPLDAKARRQMPRVERYPDTFSGSFARRTKQLAVEPDFVRVTVSRSGLLDAFEMPSPLECRRRLSAARIRRASAEGIAALQSLSHESRNVLSRSDVMASLVYKHELSTRHGGEEGAVWKHLSARFPELGRPGRRRKPPTQ